MEPTIKGLKFNQLLLQPDLQAVQAGQRSTTKITLTALLILVYFVAGSLAGLTGVTAGFEIGADAGFRIDYILTLVTVFLWIGLGIKSFRLSIPVTIVWLILVPLFLSLYANLTGNKIPYNFGSAAISQFLPFSTVSFSLFCFANALIKVVFDRSRLLNLLRLGVLFGVLAGCIASAYYVIYPTLQVQPGQELSSYGKLWLSSPAAKVSIVLPAIICTLFFAISARFANQTRKIPSSPSSPFSLFLSSLVLSTGTWRGTSFHNLDLSNVNFMGAKLENSDLRAHKLCRTCLQGVTGLDKARVDNRYLDLDLPKVQKLLTHGRAEERDFSRLNLRGAYLQGADLRRMDFADTELTDADLRNADLRGVILVRTNVTGVDFSNANLTGVCIEDWNVNNQTLFTDVQCDYIYRKLDDHRELADRFPADRNFEPREFESLYQEVGNVVELIFREGFNWRAVAFTLQKLQLEDEELGLELRGIEKRGDLWVAKVAHNESVSGAEVERRLYPQIEEMQKLLATKEQQINKLLGIASDQAEALKEFSRKSFGNSFFITGSTITNLTGQGQIEYAEAANQVRSIIASATNPGQVITTAQTLISQLQSQEIAVTLRAQTDFIQQILLTEAQKDPVFQQFLLQQGQQIIDVMPNSAIATAIKGAIAQLNDEGSSGIV